MSCAPLVGHLPEIASSKEVRKESSLDSGYNNLYCLRPYRKEVPDISRFFVVLFLFCLFVCFLLCGFF